MITNRVYEITKLIAEAAEEAESFGPSNLVYEITSLIHSDEE